MNYEYYVFNQSSDMQFPEMPSAMLVVKQTRTSPESKNRKREDMTVVNPLIEETRVYGIETDVIIIILFIN